MSELEIERSELPDANVFCVRLIGSNVYVESEANARTLVERLVREERDGLIMDYRECVLGHTLEEFAAVAHIFVGGLAGRRIRVAYVYGQGNMMHALYMTKLMQEGGLDARAFERWEDAEEFAKAA
ncbi:hypothetical protein DDZ18_07750 [Marinicauda salina]|jgi:hypothetical protein|uniref:STAS/SEC14 domain-containing protein n=1 Tax=Marinicauda salina TaxID=2135793 RepID=A0A2U2BU59_9PROT|nr:hypothetical protein [Marinicauda salina]PWE17556.1 hypothetical protein DDZ18_07750 [Marinicauda salina]